MHKLTKRHEQEVTDLLTTIAYEGHTVRNRGWLLRVYGQQRVTKTVWRDLADRWAETERPNGHDDDTLWTWYEPKENSAVVFLRQSPKPQDDNGKAGDRSLMPLVRRRT